MYHLKNTTDSFIRGASEMSCLHNCIIRGINSIYLQARNVAPTKISAITPDNKADIQIRDDFVDYAKEWSSFVHLHHSVEESHMFPFIESATGVKGIMDKNVEQHRLFDDGLERYNKYLERVQTPPQGTERVGEDKFLYGPEFVEIIESFASILCSHLYEEIGTLISLRVYDGMLNLDQILQDEGEKAMKSASMTGVIQFAFHNLDADFEGGLYKNFPPAPWFIKFLCVYILWIPNRRMWKFSYSNSASKLRPKLLYAWSISTRLENRAESFTTQDRAEFFSSEPVIILSPFILFPPPPGVSMYLV